MVLFAGTVSLVVGTGNVLLLTGIVSLVGWVWFVVIVVLVLGVVSF